MFNKKVKDRLLKVEMDLHYQRRELGSFWDRERYDNQMSVAVLNDIQRQLVVHQSVIDSIMSNLQLAEGDKDE
jgi:hypothetical protein